VANLDSLYLMAGTEYPHEVWLRTDPKIDPESIIYAIRGYSITLDSQAVQSRLVENGLNTLVQSWTSARNDILTAQQRPERQGLFGLLSVWFCRLGAADRFGLSAVCPVFIPPPFH